MREIYHLSEQFKLLEDHIVELASGSAGCPDCLWKHLNAVVGYAHEVETLSDTEEMKQFYQKVGDQARDWRKAIFEVESNPEALTQIQGHNPGGPDPGNPGDFPDECTFSKETVKPKSYFDPTSFRTICPQSPTGRCKDLPSKLACASRVIIGCKKGKFKKGKCSIGTEAHVIMHNPGIHKHDFCDEVWRQSIGHYGGLFVEIPEEKFKSFKSRFPGSQFPRRKKLNVVQDMGFGVEFEGRFHKKYPRSSGRYYDLFFADRSKGLKTLDKLIDKHRCLRRWKD